MRLRFGMRLGSGLWVSGGFGIILLYAFLWMMAVAFATTIFLGLLIACAILLLIKILIAKKSLHKRHQDDLALFQRIAAKRVQHVQYKSSGSTNPPGLWGIYAIEPSIGPSYVRYGQHPVTLRKLWLENRCGKVRELMVLPDKPMAVALLDLFQRGVCRVKPNATRVCIGFTNSMPIHRDINS